MNAILGWLGAGFAACGKLRAVCIRHYLLGRLARAGRGISLGEDVRFYGPRRIQVEDEVVIGHHVILRALESYPWTDPAQAFAPELVLRRGCYVGHFTQISCVQRVVVGEEVMIADRCFLADNQHTYLDPARSVKAQPLTVCGEVHIGAGSWIGTNSSVLGNVRIGRHCVVGANSAVTGDLPDFSVAVGAPARIIKRYDADRQAWRSTSPDGAWAS